MKIARIVNVDYDEFIKQLTIAKREKRCLDPMLDKDEWALETQRQELKVTAFASIVSERHQAEEMFLLNEGPAEWSGLFAIDRETRTCVRFVVEEV